MEYAHTNLKTDVDDMAAQFGLESQIEMRYGRTPLACEKLGVTYMRLAPGFRSPFAHRHREQEEVYIVVSGDGRAKVEDDIVELRQWDALRVAPQAIRAVEAGSQGLELVIVGAPLVADVSDGEVIEGWWGNSGFDPAVKEGLDRIHAHRHRLQEERKQQAEEAGR